jgi:hypothetical protein
LGIKGFIVVVVVVVSSLVLWSVYNSDS